MGVGVGLRVGVGVGAGVLTTKINGDPPSVLMLYKPGDVLDGTLNDPKQAFT